MTNIESIYEIKTAVLDLRRYASSNNEYVSNKVKVKYQKLLDRFFRENESLVTPQQRRSCLYDVGYFLILMDEAVEQYYLESAG